MPPSAATGWRRRGCNSTVRFAATGGSAAVGSAPSGRGETGFWRMTEPPVTDPYHIAVVGAGALLPGAADPAAFWANVAAGRDCARDVPPGRWPLDPASVHQPGGPTPDKV